MPAVRQNYRFTRSELVWIAEQYHTKAIQDILAEAPNTKPFKRAAIQLEPKFREVFTEPYQGESEADFQARKKRAKAANKIKVQRHMPETQEHWEARMAKLRRVCVAWSV